MERGLTTILAFFLIVMVVVLVGRYETARIDKRKAGAATTEARQRVDQEFQWLNREEDLPIELKRLQARWKVVKDLTVAELDRMTPEQLKQINVGLITNLGTIVLEFYPDEAPKHVRNYIKLANEGYYDNTLIHRVVPDFVIQGGKGSYKVGYSLKAEISDRKHKRGTLAMARTQKGLDTASTEFYICLGDESDLDNQYTIFGRVIFGMDVVDTIASVPVGSKDRPKHPVAVWKAVVLEPITEE